MTAIKESSVVLYISGGLNPFVQANFELINPEKAKSEIEERWTKSIFKEYGQWVLEEISAIEQFAKFCDPIPGMGDFLLDAESIHSVQMYWDALTENGKENIVYTIDAPEAIADFITNDQTFALIVETVELEELIWYTKYDLDEEGINRSTGKEEKIECLLSLLAYREGWTGMREFDSLQTFKKPKPKIIKMLKEYSAHLKSLVTEEKSD